MPHVPDLSGCALNGRYELYAVIGEGSFGRVYEGCDRRLGRPVAVKVIKPWWAEDPRWVTDFERETRLLARISDPGIVQIYDVGDAPEGRYYVSELVRGQNLAQLLAGGPLAPWRAAGIAAQLCRALAGAHAQRIVHRDVKPSNVLLSSSGLVKVGDFGVAGLASTSGDDATGAGTETIVGTPAYMAPEQSRGRPVTPATDVYSAGIVLYELLAGRRPFTATAAVDLALCHLQDPPPPLPESVPEALVAIVDRALAKQPAERFVDGSEMADALVHARRQAGEQVLASSSARPGGQVVGSAAARPGETRRAPLVSRRAVHNPSARRRAVAAVGAAVALAGAMAVGAVALGDDGHLKPLHDPARVQIPNVVGSSTSAAESALRHHHLRAHVVRVPWPGHAPGTVRAEHPRSRSVRRGSRVTLDVADVPSWKPLTQFEQTSSPVFRVRGERWRIVYASSDERSCTLWVFCSHTSASITDTSSGSTVDSFDLTDGTGRTQVFATGPGTYQIKIDPASGDARWSFTVQDWY